MAAAAYRRIRGRVHGPGRASNAAIRPASRRPPSAGRPHRGRSASPAIPSSLNRVIQRRTVDGWQSSSSAIWDGANPCKDSSTFHDLCAGFGVDGPSDASAQFRTLVSPSWNRYRSDLLAHRSALTETGAPVEISIKIDGRGDVSLRYVVDAADHSLDITGNVETYIAAAQLASGQPEGPLRRLFGTHLDGCAPHTLPTVMHGVGLASGGRRRGSLYFPAGWLETDELVQRLPHPTTLPRRAEVVGYDFSASGLTRWKTYHWLPIDPRRPMADRSEIEEQLPHAAAVYDHFANSVPGQVRGTATFLQQSIDGAGRHQRIFFFTRPWGWASPTGLGLVLGFLSAIVEIDLKTPLQLVRSVTRNHGLAVHLGLVAIGGNTSPSLTLYFWPK